jgi:thiamine pyrophosphokinase
MRGIILLNGMPYSKDIDDKNAIVYCCDGAYNWAKGKLHINKNIGDFDSLPYIPTPPPEEIYPSEKDFTDGEIALFKMLKEGVEDISIYGGSGKRCDHFFGNCQLLYAAYKNNVPAKLIDECQQISIQGGKIQLGQYVGKTFSLLPFCAPVHIMDSAGCKYAYPPKIDFGECRGISNIVTGANAYVCLKDGDCALVIVNLGDV